MGVTVKKRKAPRAEQLQMLADEAGRLSREELPAMRESVPVEVKVQVEVSGSDLTRGPFGGWLLQQVQHRREWIAVLAKAAKLDPRWPKRGTAVDVREHLHRLGADGDAFEAVDDAELEWLCV